MFRVRSVEVHCRINENILETCCESSLGHLSLTPLGDFTGSIVGARSLLSVHCIHVVTIIEQTIDIHITTQKHKKINKYTTIERINIVSTLIRICLCRFCWVSTTRWLLVGNDWIVHHLSDKLLSTLNRPAELLPWIRFEWLMEKHPVWMVVTLDE